MPVTPSTPTTTSPSRPRPATLRLNPIGIDPGDIVGKVVKHARSSTSHPTLTIEFDDDTSVQIRVDGYDPQHPGIPKMLEMDPRLSEIISQDQPVGLTILDCAFVTLSDKAFERTKKENHEVIEAQWDQQHLGLAIKLSNDGKSRWHCIWASMQEREGKGGDCVFRSYEDVYLTSVRLNHNRQRHKRRNSRLTSYPNS